MIVVFWLDNGRAGWSKYGANEMSRALKFMEGLRMQRRAGEDISHVCMQSELPDVVGEAGVSDPAVDYDWRKRREDPATFGRPDDLTKDIA